MPSQAFYALPDVNNQPIAEKDAEDFNETCILPFPQPGVKCFHGLAGEFVGMIEPHTEADKTALLIQFLTYFGNITGRSAYYQVEADKHFTNLFCVLVGDTASGRKGGRGITRRDILLCVIAFDMSE